MTSKLVNGISVEMTAEEEAAFDVSRAAMVTPSIPEAVSARQFKLQLLVVGLLDAVDAWVARQPRDIQIAYEYSGTFEKDSTMMTTGFAAMGFTSEQINDFFVAAAQL